MAQKESSSFAEKITPVLLIIVVGLAFITGSLWQKVNSLGGGTTNVANNAQNAGAAAPQAAYSQLSEEQAKDFPGVSSLTITKEANNSTEGEHVRGSQDAKVVLFEYSDLECPYCSAFHTTAQQIVEEYDGQVAWVYRHFPLDSIHPNARPAAVGSECVSNLGGNEAFWAFVDKIFADQTTSLTKLADVAAEVGLDRGAYETCVSSGQTAQAVEDDYQAGLDSGVTGTPGNFVINSNGQVWTVYGAVPYATLKEAIDEALAS